MNPRRALAVAPPCCEDCGTTWGEVGSAGGTMLCLNCRIQRRQHELLAPAEPVPGGDASEENHPQAKAQAKDQGKDRVQTSTSSKPPTPRGGLDDGPELYRLMAAWREGRLKPVDVQLGEMPAHAGAVMRGIADHMRLLMGLRQAVGDHRPLPYARSMAVGAGLTKDLRFASRAINTLVRAGVIVSAGRTEPRRASDGRPLAGTKLYAPPSGGAS